MPAPTLMSPELSKVLNAVAEAARRARVFDRVEVEVGGAMGGYVSAVPVEAPEGVRFRVEPDPASRRFFVSWVSPDRYVSQSIEADLMWTGDRLDDLIDEELADQGWSGGALGEVEHFRSEDKLFTFRSQIPISVDGACPDRDAPELVRCLLAYEAAFRELGDMKPGEVDDDEPPRRSGPAGAASV